MIKQNLPSQDDPIQESGLATDQMRGWMDSITDLVDFLEILEGSGTPEGSVTAARRKQYLDTVGNILYIKTTQTGNTGWVALN